MRGILCSLLLLAGCATPGIEVRTVEVPVISVVQCVKKEDIPTKPTPVGSVKMPSSLEGVTREALAKLSEWTSYGNRADIIMKKCSTKEK